jgi:hypothetical protein
MQKRILPHVAAVLTFALLTVIYFYPYYKGMTLGAHDTTQWKAMAQETIAWKEKTGEQALWTNSMFGGMPTFQISVEYPGNLINYIPKALQPIFPEASALLFVMFVGFYILLLCFEINPWLSLAGALAYGLASFNLISIEAGHNTKVMAMALMAPAIGGMVLAYRGKVLLGAAIAGLFISLNIDANHFQITYYLLLTMGMLGVYFFVEAIIQKTLPVFAKATAALLIISVVAFLPNVANLWSTWEYGKQTMRGGGSQLSDKKTANKGGGLDIEYATRWSEGAGDFEFMTLLIPNMKGGASGSELSESSASYKALTQNGIQSAGQIIERMPTYFGDQPGTSGPVYLGAAVFFLFILGLLIVRSPVKWALLAISVFFLLLSFGHNTPFFEWCFNGLLPMFNKFRTPTMALAVLQITFPLLGILAVNEIINGTVSGDELKKKLYIAGGIVTGLIVLFGFLGIGNTFTGKGDLELAKQFPDWLMKALREDRESMLHTDAVRSLFFAAAAFGAIWLFMRKTITANTLAFSLLVVFLLDGWLVANRYLNSKDFVEDSQFAQNFQPSQADQQILQDNSLDYRVFDRTVDPFNTASPAYFHKLIGGYSPAKLQIYQDLIERHLSQGNAKVYDMLNTKYFKVADEQGNQRVIPNPAALGNAWLVSNIKHVANADEEINALSATDFDPRSTAVINKEFDALVTDQSVGADSAATIKLDVYSPNKLTYSYNAASPKVAVFSEIYYAGEHGWKAYVDGKETPHFRANYVLRAMALPAGKHTVEFKFEPKSYYTGNKIAYAGSFILLAFVFGTLGFAGYKRSKEIEAEPKTASKPTTGPTKPTNKKK